MNKAELFTTIAEKANLRKKEAAAALAALTATITDTLKDGESLTLVGFGTFEVKTRAARTGKNPRTGEAIQIAESKIPTFKPGKGLKSAVE